jgi:hypothetical protein
MTGQDELRELADRLEPEGKALAARLHGYADAWEADVSDMCTINAELNVTIIRLSKRLEAAERMRDHYKAEGDAFHALSECVRKRLEAAEKLLQDLDGGLDDYWAECNPEIVAAFAAALAGEKP